MDETIVREMLKKAGLSEPEIEAKIEILRNDAKKPVKLIGIGQTGVGKTELIRSIFQIRRSDIESLRDFRTNPVLSETGAFRGLKMDKAEVSRDTLFQSIEITSKHALKV